MMRQGGRECRSRDFLHEESLSNGVLTPTHRPCLPLLLVGGRLFHDSCFRFPESCFRGSESGSLSGFDQAQQGRRLLIVPSFRRFTIRRCGRKLLLYLVWYTKYPPQLVSESCCFLAVLSVTDNLGSWGRFEKLTSKLS
jgi:hypothetical protein